MSKLNPTKVNSDNTSHCQQMYHCWNSSATPSHTDFDVPTSRATSIENGVLWANNQAAAGNPCSLEQSVGEEPWPDCADIFTVLSNLELQAAAPQPGDDYYLQNLPTSNFTPDDLVIEFNEDINDLPQNHRRTGKAEAKRKKQSKGNQAQEPPENGLSEECNFDDSIMRKRCSERRRRKRIKAKLKSLQQLIPNSDKQDQASILGDTIKYIQSLKFQLDMILKLSGQNQVQATCLPQTHQSMISPVYGIGAPRQFQMGPSGYGLIVSAQSIQVASIPQPHVAVPAILCPQGYFPSAGATGSFPPTFDPAQQHSVPSYYNQQPTSLT